MFLNQSLTHLLQKLWSQISVQILPDHSDSKGDLNIILQSTAVYAFDNSWHKTSSNKSLGWSFLKPPNQSKTQNLPTQALIEPHRKHLAKMFILNSAIALYVYRCSWQDVSMQNCTHGNKRMASAFRRGHSLYVICIDKHTTGSLFYSRTMECTALYLYPLYNTLHFHLLSSEKSSSEQYVPVVSA